MPSQDVRTTAVVIPMGREWAMSWDTISFFLTPIVISRSSCLEITCKAKTEKLYVLKIHFQFS